MLAQTFTTRSLALAGVIGVILFVSVFLILGFISPGYSPMRQTISSIALYQYGWIQDFNFVISGTLLVAFSVGFHQTMRRIISKRLMAASILLSVGGLGLVIGGTFVTDPSGPVHSLRGILHFVGFLLFAFPLPVAFLIVGRQLLKLSEWRKYGWYSVAVGFATFVLIVTFFSVMGIAPQFTGLVNRIHAIVALTWYVVMGYRLFGLKASLDRHSIQTS
jgi:hypothetical membrane protein